MSYRDDVEALGHRCEALERDVSAKAKDLAEARRLLDEATRRLRLPVLDNLHIAAPCKADWAKMTGDARARFCGQCEKSVYNLSDMTRAEAEALLIAKEGKLCVRYYQRADGTIITADCPEGLARRRRRRRIVAVSFGAMSVFTTATMALFHRGTHLTMGAVRPAPIHSNGKVETPQTKVMGQIEEPIMGDTMPTMGEVAAPPPHAKMGKIRIDPKAVK